MAEPEKTPVPVGPGKFEIPLTVNIVGVLAIVTMVAGGAAWTTRVSDRLDLLTDGMEKVQAAVQESSREAKEAVQESSIDRWKWSDMAAWQKSIERELDRWVSDLNRELNARFPEAPVDIPLIEFPEMLSPRGPR